jgi:pyridoxal phosphate enzyme (YggS family)
MDAVATPKKILPKIRERGRNRHLGRREVFGETGAGSIMNPSVLAANLETVRQRIADAAKRSSRAAEEVTLVGVTKRNPPELARALIELGVSDLGENYPQELWSKVDALNDCRPRWHLIGHLQGNKARRTLPLVTMIHAVDSLKLLRTLNALADDMHDPPRVCLQVNCSGEPAKHGWAPSAILNDSEAIAACRSIPIVGLMTMAAYDIAPDVARPAFVRLRETRDALQARTGLALPELSMGMSNDFEVAVEEGATLVRVGSALFAGVAS